MVMRTGVEVGRAGRLVFVGASTGLDVGVAVAVGVGEKVGVGGGDAMSAAGGGVSVKG